MTDFTIQPQAQKAVDSQPALEVERQKKPSWETPRLEDVSEQVMAQPYIRFT
jgi:hypothetical protein